MPTGAWNFLMDDETYQLLLDYHGSNIVDVIDAMDKNTVLRILDNIIGDCDSPGDEETRQQARRAKQRVTAAEELA